MQGLKKRYDEYQDTVELQPANKAAESALACQAAEACQESLNRLQVVKPSAASGRSLLLTGEHCECNSGSESFLITQCHISKLMTSVHT